MGLWVDKEAESEGGAWKKEKRKRRKSVRVKRVRQEKDERVGKERPEQGGAKQAERKVKGKKKRGGEREYEGSGGSWGDARATGSAPRAEPRGWNPDAGRGRGRRDSGWGPPGGAGDHQTLHRPETVSWRECRKELEARLASPHLTSRPRAGASAYPSPAMPPDPPALGGDTQAPLAFFPRHPTAPPPRCPGTPAADPRDPVPGPSARSGVRRPGGHGGSSPREVGPGGGGGRGRGAAEFPTFSPGPDAAGVDGTSRALPSSPASWSHAPRWKLPREAGPRAGRTRGADGAGRRPAAGGGGSGGAAVAAGKNC